METPNSRLNREDLGPEAERLNAELLTIVRNTSMTPQDAKAMLKAWIAKAADFQNLDIARAGKLKSEGLIGANYLLALGRFFSAQCEIDQQSAVFYDNK